jgi:hypothetical protein
MAFVAKENEVSRRWLTPVIGLVLLATALAARAPGLGSFSWPDELTWLERSSAFVTALERGDLAGTYLCDHPGVVPMWGYGTALYLRARITGDRAPLDALAAQEFQGDVPAQLATAALFTVILTSLAVVAAFWLLIPLMGRVGATAAGFLIALDPFYLTHSRIVHVDGILTSLMLLATLSLLLFLKRPERRRYLFLSGFFGGLALLTKTPALFLIPLVALALGVQWLLGRLGRAPRSGVGHAALAFVAWLATVWGTFLALWPAAWTRPLYYTYRLFRASNWAGTVSHGFNFFLGRPIDDPGFGYYWVVFPFRLSPLVMILLPVSVVLLVLAWKRRDDVRVPVVGLSFVFFFLVMVSLAAKKGDRYSLPVFPPADVVAAWALVGLWHRFRPARHRAQAGYAVLAAVVLLPSLLWLRLAPYYGAYFNPVVGGGRVAERTFAFGQGEGLDLAAEYLNQKPDSQDLLAISFYPSQFRYHFEGMATSLRRGDWDKTWLFADYVVFYISQVQRELPTAELVNFFLAQEPEHVVRLGGARFARIYATPLLLSGRPPAVEQEVDGLRLGEELGLVGFALGERQARPGQAFYVTLDWQALIQMGQDYELRLELVDAARQTVWQQQGQPFDGYFPTSWWPPGRIMHDRYRIDLPADLAAGPYRLVVGAVDAGDGHPVLAPYGPVYDLRPGSLLVTEIEVGDAP